jgi:hypothetical protein
VGAASFGVAGGLNRRANGYEAATWSYLAAGAFLGGMGTLTLLGTSDGEKLEADYRRGLLANEDRGRLVALTEERLREIAEDERRKRLLVKVSSGMTLAVGAALTVWVETSKPALPENHGRSLSRLVGPMIMIGSGGALLNAFLQSSPTEHVLEAWNADTARRELPQLSIVPLPAGGAMLSVSGRF